MFWLHIRGEDVKLWHPFTSQNNLNIYGDTHGIDTFDQIGCLVFDGPEVKPEWILRARYYSHRPRGDVRVFCKSIKKFLLRVAARLEYAGFWDAGWVVRKFSFTFNKKV